MFFTTDASIFELFFYIVIFSIIFFTFHDFDKVNVKKNNIKKIKLFQFISNKRYRKDLILLLLFVTTIFWTIVNKQNSILHNLMLFLNLLVFISLLSLLLQVIKVIINDIMKLKLIIDYISNYDFTPIMFCLTVPSMYIVLTLLAKYGQASITYTFNNWRVNFVMIFCLIIGQYLIFKGLIDSIENDERLIFKNSQYIRLSKYIGIIAWLLVLILVLYSQVVVISQLQPEAFFSSHGSVTNYLDLLYFTIVTFATIGYGDITPATIAGKLESINIIVSSFFFIIIFISTIISKELKSIQK